MKISTQETKQREIEFDITLSAEDMKPYIDSAVKEISKEVSIQGFRPGHATYDALAQKVGEMEIWKFAADKAIPKALMQAMKEKDIELATRPNVNIEKIAPNNDFHFTAKAALVPEVTMPEWDKLSMKKKEVKVTDEDVDKALDQLREMQVSFKEKEGKAAKNDQVKIDLDVLRDGVVIENGSYKDMEVRLGEGKMIPGFEDALIGLSKDEEKSFDLEFPKEYHAKDLAGQKATFKVKVKAVQDVVLPEINDDFAKKVNFKDLEDLKTQIKQRIEMEKQQQMGQEEENELIELLVEKSKFSEISPLLVDKETHSMLHELEHQVKHQGMKFDDYLQQLKKTPKELMLDMTPQAIKRVKSAILLHHVCEKENLHAKDEEVETQVRNLCEVYKQDPAKVAEFKTPAYKVYAKNMMSNKNTIEFLKKKVVKDS